MSQPSGTSTPSPTSTTTPGGGGMQGGPYGVGSSSDRTSLDMGGTTTTQSGSMQTTPQRYETATARIAGAHCDREMACNQIGPNKRFASREVCAREKDQKVRDEVKQSDCSSDIDANKLQSCLTSIAQQDCSSLGASMSTVEACKSSALCR